MTTTAIFLLWLTPLLAGVLGYSVQPRPRVLVNRLAIGAMLLGMVGAAYLVQEFWLSSRDGVPQAPYSARALWVGISEGFQLLVGLHVDRLTALLLGLVHFIGLLVYVYSARYLQGEGSLRRYWLYLGLFIFAMDGILLSDNLVQLFIFWELVGFASYLLIGYWYPRQAAGRSAQQAFLLNRVGDAAFLLALAGLLFLFSTTDIEALRQLMQGSRLEAGSWQAVVQFSGGEQQMRSLPAEWLHGIGLLLLLAVVAKSAQFPLQGWLPDAMTGPTPVSALLHAATMVAAGVYLLSRIYPLLTLPVLTVLAVVGALTAVLGGVAAVWQTDLKRLLAYSTLSQLGYMVLGMGTFAHADALFHLLTHAFFKAGLFLGAGAIVLSLQRYAAAQGLTGYNLQDIRRMGGLSRALPVLHLSFAAMALSLAGAPLFSGFLSKEGLLAGAWGWAQHLSATGSGLWVWAVPALALLGAFLSAYYVFRMLVLVLWGESRFPGRRGKAFTRGELPRPPVVLWLPVVLLALLSLGFAFSLNPFSTEGNILLKSFLPPSPTVPFEMEAGGASFFALRSGVWAAADAAHGLITLLSLSLFFLALALVVYNYRRRQLLTLPEGAPRSTLGRLSYAGFAAPVVYIRLVGRPVLALGHLLRWFDERVIDSLVNWLPVALAGDTPADRSLARGAATLDDRGVDRLVTGTANAVGEFRWLGRDWSLARASDRLDRNVLDALVHRVANGVTRSGKLSRALQSGKVQRYLIWALLLFGGSLAWWLAR